jgi:hypothetical protein
LIDYHIISPLPPSPFSPPFLWLCFATSTY